MLGWIERVERTIGFIGISAAVIILPLMIAVRIYEIVARKLFQAPSTFLQLIEWEAFTLLILLTIGFAYVRDQHVRVDILRENLGRRTRALIELIGLIFFIVPLCAIVFWFGADYVATAYNGGERAALTLFRPFKWVIKASLLFGMLLLLLAMICRVLRNFHELSDGGS